MATLSKQNCQQLYPPRSSLLYVLDSLLHIVGTCIFVYAWGWHFTEPAAKLPGTVGFGWFYKYLTFWGLTLIALAYSLATFRLLAPIQAVRKALSGVVDDLSCLNFTVATVVTVQFHVVDYVTQGLVLPSADRPWWLGHTVHVLNSVFALLDLLVSRPRSFSGRYHILSVLFTVTYTGMINLCRYKNGAFPYPFLNKMPFPAGPIAVMSTSFFTFYLVGKLGAVIGRAAGNSKSVMPQAQAAGRLQSNGSKKPKRV